MSGENTNCNLVERDAVQHRRFRSIRVPDDGGRRLPRKVGTNVPDFMVPLLSDYYKRPGVI
jgi:hypothetical protein